MSEDLKNCPFCGGGNIGWNGGNGSGVIYACMNCGAEGPTSEGDPEEEKVWEKAAKAWNTRAAPKVKPLVWEIFDAQTAWSKSPFGIYRYDAQKITLSTQNNYVGDGLGNWRMENLEAAKAAAQADYNRRILSALEMEG